MYDGKTLGEKKDIFISLLTLSLLTNGFALLEDLEATPLELVSGIHKVPFNGCYLPSSMVGALTPVKKYLSLDRFYPGLPPIVGMQRVTLEQYLSSWMPAKHKGILTSEEKITFDSIYESWPVFRIETTGILIKYGLQELLPQTLPSGSGLPPHLYFQSSWMGEVLKMAVNNLPLRWPMH